MKKTAPPNKDYRVVVRAEIVTEEEEAYDISAPSYSAAVKEAMSRFDEEYAIAARSTIEIEVDRYE